jgi:hypothetical protein
MITFCECGHGRESHDLDDACSACRCRAMSNPADMNLPMVKVARERHELRLHRNRKALRGATVIAITAAYFLTYSSVVLAVVIAAGLVGEIASERWQKRQEVP